MNTVHVNKAVPCMQSVSNAVCGLSLQLLILAVLQKSDLPLPEAVKAGSADRVIVRQLGHA